MVEGMLLTMVCINRGGGVLEVKVTNRGGETGALREETAEPLEGHCALAALQELIAGKQLGVPSMNELSQRVIYVKEEKSLCHWAPHLRYEGAGAQILSRGFIGSTPSSSCEPVCQEQEGKDMLDNLDGALVKASAHDDEEAYEEWVSEAESYSTSTLT